MKFNKCRNLGKNKLSTKSELAGRASGRLSYRERRFSETGHRKRGKWAKWLLVTVAMDYALC